MNVRVFLSDSPEATENVGAQLAAHLRRGDLVAVAGELGSGKTTFIRGACRALGITQPVTSPTYTIGNRYEGHPSVSHLDLYRIEAISDSDWGDVEAYFEEAIVFVEWPEAGVGRFPPPRVSVRLEHAGRDRREVTIESAEADLLAGLR